MLRSAVLSVVRPAARRAAMQPPMALSVRQVGGRPRRKLGRTSGHRRALFRTQVTQLIQHDRIHTTLPKAKELRRIADRMVKYAKRGTQHDWNMANAFVRDRATVSKLFSVLGPRYRLREGGYTRIMRTFRRQGDNAPMACIEFVDREGELRPAKPVRVPASTLAELEAEAGEEVLAV